MKFAYQAVERIPKQLQPETVYHSEEFELAGLLCACGCGHRITLLVPDSHQVYCDGGFATIRPSIAVCDGPCKSHYFISAGQVEWLEAYSTEAAKSLMEMQILRHVASDPKPKSWLACLRSGARRLFDQIKSMFGR
jgi:Family of unknown function (DUF6527)